MQPNDHRPPGEAEEPAENDTLDGAYTPGDSFANDPSDQGGASELPSWLQDFAGAAGESGGSAQQGSAPAARDLTTAPLDEAPGKASEVGRQPAPDPQTMTTDPFSQAPAGSDANFFSEDDLPEWLRALNTESDQGTEASPAAPMPVVQAAQNGSLPVPPVSRAWVTASDPPDASPSANLMSSLVNVIDSRPDVVPTESAVSTTPSPSGAPVAAAPQAAAAPAPAPVDLEAERRAKRTRMLLIAVIVVLVLVIILQQLGN